MLDHVTLFECSFAWRMLLLEQNPLRYRQHSFTTKAESNRCRSKTQGMSGNMSISVSM